MDELARAHTLDGVSVFNGQTSGFRLRARLAIRGRVGSPKIGLFELGTHHVVHIPTCSVQHPLINRVAAIVRRALVDAQVTTYSDKAHLGIARYLQVAVERCSQTAQVVIIANSESVAPLAACLDLIRERLGPELHSLWFNANREHTNTILGPTFENWCGPASLLEHFGESAIHYPPGAFGQSNLEVAQHIIDYVRSRIPRGARVTEFYAGVGAIGLSVLSQADAITLNEVNPHSLHGLELALAQLSETDRRKVSVLAGAAGSAQLATSDAQVVIADPPRKGLNPPLAEYLSERPPERLLYVSCGLESLLNDTARLLSHGKLRLAELMAFNLLPFTDHVETVACFDRI